MIHISESNIIIILRYMYTMPTILEPISVGILVAVINKYIINNHHLFDCQNGESTVIHDDAVSSTSSTTEAIEIHAHF